MDCRTARLLVDVQRIHATEVDADELAALEAHLIQCPECAALADTERQVDVRLGSAMCAVPIPANLEGALLRRLAADRRLILRHKAARIVRGLSAVAAILLLFCGISYWLTARPPAVKLEAALNSSAEKILSPQPESVAHWFQQHRDVTMKAPEHFDYLYLVHYDMGQLQGKPVPQLVFVRERPQGRFWATCFVLSRKQFDFRQLPEDLSVFHTLGYSIGALRDSDNEDTAYLVIFTGDTLDPILSGRAG